MRHVYSKDMQISIVFFIPNNSFDIFRLNKEVLNLKIQFNYKRNNKLPIPFTPSSGKSF